jgi:hypothetical protein
LGRQEKGRGDFFSKNSGEKSNSKNFWGKIELQVPGEEVVKFIEKFIGNF